MIGACRRHLGGVLLAGFALSAGAHPLAPALLDLQQQADGSYAVLWRTSVTRAQGRDVLPRLPADCRRTQTAPVTTEENQAVVQRWTLRCDAPGLIGKTLAIEGLQRSGINVILRIEDRAGAVTQTLLDAGRSQFVVPAPDASPAVFRDYLSLGVEHLLLGLDHVLFVLGLMLLVKRLRPLVVTITCFTAGHSVTLSLASLGVVQVNPALTELGIAASILVLAVELARPVAAASSLLARRPGLMALSFGLLHGLGFAGALTGIGLPQAEIPLALLAFNLGIEIGQLLLIAAILLLAAGWRQIARWTPDLGVPASAAMARSLPVYLLGSLAAFWCFERMAAFLA